MGISEKQLASLSQIFSNDSIIFGDENRLASYAGDESWCLPVTPAATVLPSSTAQLGELLAFCSAEKIPVTPRGGGTGKCGGCVPSPNGLVVSLERMNRVIDIDTANFCVRAEPGVILEHLHNAVEAAGLFYPPDPNSLDSCTIGGNLATSAGGPRCIKYGITRDYVLALEAVLPGGQAIRFGGGYNKIATGYNLAQLLVGSEGTLGVISEVLLRLIPRPAAVIDLLVPFTSYNDAAQLIPEILQRGWDPAIIEFVDRNVVKYSERFLARPLPFSDEAGAQLLIELDGRDRDGVNRRAEALGEYLAENGALEVLVAETERERNRLWEMRRTLAEALKHLCPNRVGEDVVVPRARIPELLERCRGLGDELGLEVIIYGHAGDGNVHVNLADNEVSNEVWERRKPDAVRRLFALAVSLGGTISGEHGIGLTKKPYLPMVMGETELKVMRKIKRELDPGNIMNPGKIFDI